MIIGFMFVSFPSVAACFLYQAMDYFGLAMVFAFIGAYSIVEKSVASSIIGIAFLVISLGAYQAFLGIPVAILLFDCMMDCLKNRPAKGIIIKGIKYCCIIALAVGIYYLVLKIQLNTSNVELSNYKGMNSVINNLAPDIFIRSIRQAWIDVFRYYSLNCFGVINNSFSWVNTVLSVLSLLQCILIIKKYNTLNSIVNIVLFILLYLLIPISVNIIGVLAANQTFYYISCTPFVLLFALPLMLTDDELFVSDSGVLGIRKIPVITAMLLLLICMGWINQDNMVYQKNGMMNKEFDSRLTVLASRIQSTPGYDTETKVVFVGNPPYEFLKPSGMLNTIDNSINTVAFGLYRTEDMFYAEGVLDAYYNNVLSLPLNVISNGELNQNEIIEKKSVYPSDGSIQRVDDIIIVKLSQIT